MCSLKIALILAISLFGASQAVVRQGQCPQLSAKLDFNLNQYLGHWYEIQRYEQEFQVAMECTTADYTLADPNVARVTVVNSGVVFTGNSANAFEARGVAVPTFPADTRNPAKLNVAFFGQEPDRSNYWVLDTDYTSYSVVWSCEQTSPTSYTEYAWVLSREQYMTPEMYARVYRVIAANNINIDDFRFTEQSARCYLL